MLSVVYLESEMLVSEENIKFVCWYFQANIMKMENWIIHITITWMVCSLTQILQVDIMVKKKISQKDGYDGVSPALNDKRELGRARADDRHHGEEMEGCSKG